MQEIERKFTVNKKLWDELEKPIPQLIKQSYLSQNKACTVRIRIKGEKGYLTIKGETKNISRAEFEYEIPLEDALSMIQQFSEKTLSKNRYEIEIGDHIWEVDEFHGKLNGLIIAEIELKTEDESFILPEWVIEDVSTNPRYYNSNLINEL
jgi:CYTH domain-containing protein